MSDLDSLLATLQAGGAMIYPLVVLAIIAMLLILDKLVLFARYSRLPRATGRLVEDDRVAWPEIERALAALNRRNYLRRFLTIILAARDRPIWWIESAAAAEAGRIERAVGRGLWVLETIVTAAPLLGLLGTIAGMVRAFRLYGSQSLVDPAGVTGGVAEALIATAVGLFVALLALFAFNYLSQRQARLIDEMERLGTRMVDHIRLERNEGSRPGKKEPSHEAA